MAVNDFHTHFIPEEIAGHTSFFKGVWADKQAFLKFLEDNDIEYVHIVYPSTDAHKKIGWQKLVETYNSRMRLLMEENSRIAASAIVNLEEAGEEKVFKDLKESGFKSISLPSSYEGRFFAERAGGIFGFAEKYSLAVFIHPQIINPIGFERVKDPLLMPVLEYSFDVSMCLGIFMMEGIFEEFPNLKVVFSSLGGVIPFLKDRFDGVYAMLRQRGMIKDLKTKPSSIMKKAYVDLSGIRSKKMAEMAVEFFEPSHVLFGSDYPANQDISSQISCLEFLRQEDRERILFKNFREILGV